MGRIKTKLIKRISNELFQNNKEKLKTDFNENKEIIGTLADFPSKKLRNIVAGYITRLMKKSE